LAIARRRLQDAFARRRAQDAFARRRAQDAFARRRAQDAFARRRAQDAFARRRAQDAFARRGAQDAFARRRAQDAFARRRLQDAFARRRLQDAFARRRAQDAFARRRAPDRAPLASEAPRQLVDREALHDRPAVRAGGAAVRALDGLEPRAGLGRAHAVAGAQGRVTRDGGEHRAEPLGGGARAALLGELGEELAEQRRRIGALAQL